jgi:hypothetical protein
MAVHGLPHVADDYLSVWGLENRIRGSMLSGNSGGHVAECETKKVGRPKAAQTLPLIFAQNRPKVVRELTLEAPVAQLIEDYASWAADTGGISRDEARVLLLGRSIDDFVRKDRLYNQFLHDQKGMETK